MASRPVKIKAVTRIFGRILAGDGIDVTRANGRYTISVDEAWLNDHNLARETLSEDRTYYVRPDGNNANDGLTNSAGGAFATIQKALDVIERLDVRGNFVFVQLGIAGTYAGATVRQSPPGMRNAQHLQIVGDDANPANYIIAGGSGNALSIGDSAGAGAQVYVHGVKVTSTGGDGFEVFDGSYLLWGNIDCGDCFFAHFHWHTGGYGLTQAGYTVSGDADYHMFGAERAEVITHGKTVTWDNNTFGTTYYCGAGCYFSIESMTHVNGNTVTGRQYLSDGGFILAGNSLSPVGGGSDPIPGDVDGETSAGGRYVDGLDEWQSYAATVTAGSGSFGSAPTVEAHYKVSDGIVFYRGEIEITDIGTATRDLRVSLPTDHLSGKNVPVLAFNTDNQVVPTVKVCTGLTIYFNTTTLSIWGASGAFPATTGESVWFEASYPIG